MSQYAIQPARQGYTTYSATLEGFARDNRPEAAGFSDEEIADSAWEFESEDDAIAEAAMIAKNRKDKVLIIQKINATNASYKGIGWVYPDGEFSPGV